MKQPIQLLLAAVVLACAACSGGDDAPSRPSSTGSAATPEEDRALETLAPVRLYGAAPGEQAGAIAAGDFNGDGTGDVVLAAAFADGPGGARSDAGAAYVFLGPFEPGEERDAGGGDQALTVYGAAAGDQLGRSVAAGDFNADGIDDIFVGSPFSDGPAGDRLDAGRVDIVPGSRDIGGGLRTLDLAQDGSNLTVHGASPGDLAGFSLATARLNADAAADLLIGAFWAGGPEETRPQAGEVYAVHGGQGHAGTLDLASEPADVTVYGAAAADRLGEGVAAGDVNGDGVDDLVLPAPFAASLTRVNEAGQTYVIHSPAPAVIDLDSFAPDATVYGIDEGDQLGHITATGDIDADGGADLLLTAVSADGPANTVDLAGEAALIRGSALKVTVDVAAGAADSIVFGRSRESRLGRSATMGNLFGDSRMELILGAPGATGVDGAAGGGEVYVLSAEIGREETAPGPGRVYYGSDAGDSLGSEIFGRNPLVAADLDGDGRDELLIVAPLGDGVENRREDCGEAVILFITAVNGG